MARYKNGDFIPLIWESCTPDAYYVKGWIPFDVARDTIIGEECLADGELDGKPMRHAYAKWSTQGDAPEGCSLVLREYKESGRGRFKVTILDIYCPTVKPS